MNYSTNYTLRTEKKTEDGYGRFLKNISDLPEDGTTSQATRPQTGRTACKI
jgi:hypothetical protein